MGNIACAHKASDITKFTVKSHEAYYRFNSHVHYHGKKKGNAQIMKLLKVFDHWWWWRWWSRGGGEGGGGGGECGEGGEGVNLLIYI